MDHLILKLRLLGYIGIDSLANTLSYMDSLKELTLFIEFPSYRGNDIIIKFS